MPQVVLLRFPARSSDERIVFRDAAIVVQAYHGACVIVGLLRPVAVAAFAESDEKIAVAIEHEARPEVLAAPGLGLHAKDDFDVIETGARQSSACHLGADASRTRSRVREIHEAVVGEARMQG